MEVHAAGIDFSEPIKLREGQNTLTVTATDTDGRMYTQSVIVTAEIAGRHYPNAF